MMSVMIDFTNVLLAALLVGAMFGVWLFLNPSGSDAALYIALSSKASAGWTRRCRRSGPPLYS